MIYAIVTNYKMLTLNYLLFTFFFYLGEIFILFGYNSEISMQIGLISLVFCYTFLVFLSKSKLKSNKLGTFFQGFTLIVFLLNCLVLSIILFVLLEQIPDFLTDIIVVFNAISAVIVGVVSVLYLSSGVSTAAFLYFFGSYTLIMNDVISALETYYFESIVLNSIARILHFVAFYLIYLFAIQNKVTIKGFPQKTLT